MGASFLWLLRHPGLRDLCYSRVCFDAQIQTRRELRLLRLATLPMTVDAGSEFADALSCAQVQAVAVHAGSRPALLIDLRSPRRFHRGHIAGSHCIPSGVLLSTEPPEGELILISDAPQEAVAVIDALHEAGYPQRLRYLAEGFNGWRDRGLPIEAPVDRWPSGVARVLLPGLAGTGLLLAAAALTSLPLLALGILLLWGIWIEPALPGQPRRQRLI